MEWLMGYYVPAVRDELTFDKPGAACVLSTELALTLMSATLREMSAGI